MTAPLPRPLNARLSAMMFLQYAIWGAWLPLFFPYLTNHVKLTPEQAGNLFAIGAVGALIAPFIAGQIADRWFNTERFLGISHIVGAALVWQLGSLDTYGKLVPFALLYSLVYAPTLPLTNSLAFHHLPDRDRDFGKVRVWGTIGWIVVGIGIAQWLRLRHGDDVSAGMADSFRVSAILGALLGVFCFTLPKTPPSPGRRRFAPFEALGEIVRKPLGNPLFWLFLIAFPISCVHQFYFVHTAGFLGATMPKASFLETVFGAGGGGLMTVGQMAEIAVLAAMPLVLKRFGRKTLLAVGLCAYILRFAIFAYVPSAFAVIPALALHGLCFGCFFFVAFMVVDEETTTDVRASAQGLFNLIIVGVGVIAGNYWAGQVGKAAKTGDTFDYAHLFSVPMWVTVACFAALVVLYPRAASKAV